MKADIVLPSHPDLADVIEREARREAGEKDAFIDPQVLPSLVAIADYETATGGRIGLFVENLRTGAKVAWRVDERFVMCSTFKASLAACVLASVDKGQTRLDELIAYGPDDLLEYAPVAKQNLEKGAMSVADMCEAAVELSDNTCANALLARIGGPSALTAFWRSIGDEVSRLDHNEPELNRSPPGDPHDTTTPAAMAGNLRSLIFGKVLPSFAIQYRILYDGSMKTTLDINDQLLADAKALAAQQRTSLTRVIEEGLQLRLRSQAAPQRGKLRLPVFKGRGGLAAGVDPLSNKAMLAALGDDA
jgi:beta-lactamase class A